MSYQLFFLAGTVLLQLSKLYRSHLKRGKKLQLLHRIIEILPLSPTQLANKLAANASPELLEICRGTVRAGEPASSILNSAKRVIYSKLFGTEMLAPSPRRLLQTKEPSFLQIGDEGTSINIYEAHRSLIVPTKQVSLAESRGLLEQLKRKVRSLFSAEKPSYSHLNYSALGSHNLQELYLPDPSHCAVLARFRREGQELCCYEPILIAPSKERMVALIQEDLAGDQLQRVVLALVLVVTMGFLVKQAWSVYQRMKARPASVLGRLKKLFIRSRVCSVCRSNLSCMLSQSCMHMATCQECWPKQKQVCAECSRRNKDVVEMFVC